MQISFRKGALDGNPQAFRSLSGDCCGRGCSCNGERAYPQDKDKMHFNKAGRRDTLGTEGTLLVKFEESN